MTSVVYPRKVIVIIILKPQKVFEQRERHDRFLFRPTTKCSNTMETTQKAVQSTAPTGAISPIENYHEMQLRINKLLSKLYIRYVRRS